MYPKQPIQCFCRLGAQGLCACFDTKTCQTQPANYCADANAPRVVAKAIEYRNAEILRKTNAFQGAQTPEAFQGNPITYTYDPQTLVALHVAKKPSLVGDETQYRIEARNPSRIHYDWFPPKV